MGPVRKFDNSFPWVSGRAEGVWLTKARLNRLLKTDRDVWMGSQSGWPGVYEVLMGPSDLSKMKSRRSV